MISVLCLTVRFLDPVASYHGQGDNGEPEWPPSPLRLFQAMVAASFVNRDGQELSKIESALKWFQNLSISAIFAPAYRVGTPFRIAIPNNDLDLVAKAWSKGNTPKKGPNELKTMKTVYPALFSQECGLAAVHYLYTIPEGSFSHFKSLQTAARSITHLGWGIDMVAGNAEILSQNQIAELPGDVWNPSLDQLGTPLRVPIAGTLDNLLTKYQKFLNRLFQGGYNPVPPLTAFRTVNYRRATDPTPRPYLAFSILKSDASSFRSFDTLHRTREVAGMVRSATANSVRNIGWSEELINSFVHGHGSAKSGQATSDDRLMFLPLPSITPLKVDNIRRVLVVGPLGFSTREIENCLHGTELFKEGVTDPTAILSLISKSDNVVKNYCKSSCTWSTVTPVLLPGYDDPGNIRRKLKGITDSSTQKQLLEKLHSRVFHLLKKSFLQAGFSKELVEQIQLDWSSVGFRSGVELASRYLRPKNLNKFPAYHVKVKFPLPIHGPLVIGAGRYRGFGLFAAH